MHNTEHSFEISPRDRSIAFLLFGLLLACYLLTYTGMIQSSDGLAMFTTTESMVRRGELDSNQILWMGLQQGSFGPDGALYNRKGLGMSLLALPLVWLAQWWPRAGLVQAALLLNPILTAWTGALIYRSGRRLAWSPAVATITALVFGLATLAWPYTQTFFSDPMAAWGLFGAFYALLAFRYTGQKRYLVLGGIAWGLAYLSRAVNLVTLPVYLLALTIVLGRGTGRDLRTTLAQVGPLLTHNWRPFTSFLIPIVSAGIVSLWWNWARFGSVWETGYLESERFSAEWLFGLFGLVLSPGRGLLWYSPVLLLALFGAIWFARHKPWILSMFAALIVIYLALYGKWYMWHGGFSWGPRFLVPVIPFLALLTGPVFVWLLTTQPGAQRRSVAHLAAGAAVIVLIAASIVVQWLGMLAPFGLAQNWLAEQVEPLFAPQTFTQWRFSPLWVQQQFITGENVPFLWWGGVGTNDGATFDWLVLLLTLACIGVGAVALIWQLRTRGDGGSVRTWLYGVALIGLSLILVQHAHLPAARRAEADHVALYNTVQRIEQQENARDAILHLRPEQTQQFANLYHGDLPVYGAAPGAQLDAADQRRLQQLRTDYARLWVLPDATLPEASGWEQPLRANDFLLWEGYPYQADGPRLALYALAESQALSDNGLGAVFGTPADIGAAITPQNGSIRLDGYAVTPQTTPAGEMLLTLRWEDLRPVETDYHVFVHVLDAGGNRVAQRDGQPVQWMRPTSTWQPGEIIIDRYGLLLSDDFTPGEYTISVGLYEPVSGQRLPVSVGTGEYAIELGPVLVTGED